MLADNNKKLAENDKMINGLRTKLQISNRKVKDLQAAKKDEHAEIKKELVEKYETINYFKTELKISNKDVDDLRDALTEIKKELAEKDESINYFKTELKISNKDVDDLKAAKKDELTEIETELEKKDEIIKYLRTQFKISNKKVNDLQAAKKYYQKSILKLEKKLGRKDEHDKDELERAKASNAEMMENDVPIIVISDDEMDLDTNSQEIQNCKDASQQRI
eukprot:TRINITY_DN9338_c0_g1_i7.p1 TRINITY_DN9338_c0_g1~~TRINITY_DN9338_c0_g1_i7.p1  ORF type:complete len:259 (+),score=73.01 TRINITY_DN9338_c0_g1_i7:115-777(+)